MNKPVSINTSHIASKAALRAELAESVEAFLKAGVVTQASIGETAKLTKKPQFNHILATEPTKQAERAAAREALHAAIAELAHAEIEGVTLVRSAHEVATMLRPMGFRLVSPSVKRVAESIGIYLRE